MRRAISIGSLSLMAWIGLLPAHADEPKPSPQVEELNALTTAYDQAQKDFNEALQAAKTAEEQQKVVKELGEKAAAGTYAAKILALMREHPKDQVVRLGLQWLLWNAPSTEEARAGVDLLAREQIEDENLAALFRDLGARLGYRDVGGFAEGLIRAAIEKSPHRAVKGYARLCLARLLKRKCDNELANEAPEAEVRQRIEREAEKQYQEVIDTYADLPFQGGTLGEAAKPELDELLHLSVGKEAPEIEGEDLDGKPFKLSDYRGKVVVLDFWGNW